MFVFEKLFQASLIFANKARSFYSQIEFNQEKFAMDKHSILFVPKSATMEKTIYVQVKDDFI